MQDFLQLVAHFFFGARGSHEVCNTLSSKSASKLLGPTTIFVRPRCLNGHLLGQQVHVLVSKR